MILFFTKIHAEIHRKTRVRVLETRAHKGYTPYTPDLYKSINLITYLYIRGGEYKGIQKTRGVFGVFGGNPLPVYVSADGFDFFARGYGVFDFKSKKQLILTS
jgi:hypothetical protein